jgi:diguanylate cyclase (GGDEF)-like protein
MENLPAFTDSLTDLYNHRYFCGTRDREFRRFYENSNPLLLILYDMDFFKKFNYDSRSSVGDALLKWRIRYKKISKKYGRKK